MTFETVAYAAGEDGVAEVTLNRPQNLNALNRQLIADIRAAVRAANTDNAVGAILMTGAGRGFCSGADLANAGFEEPGVKRTPGEGIAHSMEIAYNPLVRDVVNSPKPVVTAVNGIAAGGGVGLALCGDIVVAAQSASFVQVFGPKLGLIPDMGCTWLLPKLVGRARARALTLLGDKLPAAKAAEWGLIWAVYEDEALLKEARAIAARLAQGPRLAWAAIKQVLDAAPENTLDEQLELERRVQAKLGNTEDFRTGVMAFLSKSQPKFKGV